MKIERQDFETEIPELQGQKVEFLKVSGNITTNGFQPVIFWLSTGTTTWYRFFMDTWLLHWSSYDQSKGQELMKEDFMEEENYKVKDLKKALNLGNKKILSVKMEQIEIDNLKCGQLQLSLEGNKEIVVRDFDDKRDEELIIITG